MDLEQQSNNNTTQALQNLLARPFQNQQVDLINQQQQQVYEQNLNNNNGFIRPLSQNNIFIVRSYSDLDNAQDNISNPNGDDDEEEDRDNNNINNNNNNILVLNEGDRQQDVDELQDLMMQAATLSREQANKESSSEDEDDQGEEQRKQRQFNIAELTEQPQLSQNRSDPSVLLDFYPPHPFNEPILAQRSPSPPPPPVLGAVSSSNNLDPPQFDDEFKSKKRHRDIDFADESHHPLSQTISDSYIPLKRQKNIKESLLMTLHPQSQSNRQLTYRSFDNLVRSSDNSPKDSPYLVAQQQQQQQQYRFHIGDRFVRINNTKSQTELDQQQDMLLRNDRQDEGFEELRRRRLKLQQQQNEQQEQVDGINSNVGGRVEDGQIKSVVYFAGGLSDSNIQVQLQQQQHGDQMLLKKNVSQDSYAGFIRSNEGYNKSKQQELSDAIDQINAVNQQKMRQYQQEQLIQQQQQQQQQQQVQEQFYNQKNIQQLQQQQQQQQQMYSQQFLPQQSQPFQLPQQQYPPLELHRYETAPPLQYIQSTNLSQQNLLEQQSSIPIYQPFMQRFLSTSIQNDRLSLFKQQSMNPHYMQMPFQQQQVDEEIEEDKLDIEENNSNGEVQKEITFDEEQMNSNNDDAIEVEQEIKDVPEIRISPAEELNNLVSQADSEDDEEEDNNNNNKVIAQISEAGEREEGEDSGKQQQQQICVRGEVNQLVVINDVSGKESEQQNQEKLLRIMDVNQNDLKEATDNKYDNNQNQEQPNINAPVGDDIDPAKVALQIALPNDKNPEEIQENSDLLTKEADNTTIKATSQPSMDYNQSLKEQEQPCKNDSGYSLEQQQQQQVLSQQEFPSESASQTHDQIKENQSAISPSKKHMENSLASTAEDLAQNEKTHNNCSKEGLVTYLMDLSQPSSFEIIRKLFVNLSVTEILAVIEELKNEQKIKTIELMIDRKAHHGHTNVRVDYYQNQRKEKEQDILEDRCHKENQVEKKNEINQLGDYKHGNEGLGQQNEGEKQGQIPGKQAEGHHHHHHHEHHLHHHHHHHHHQSQEETSIMMFNDDNLGSSAAISDIHKEKPLQDHKNSSDVVIKNILNTENPIVFPKGECKVAENNEHQRNNVQCNKNDNTDTNQNDQDGSQEDVDSDDKVLIEKYEQLRLHNLQMQITYQFMILHQQNKNKQKDQTEKSRDEPIQEQAEESCKVDAPPLSKHIHA